MNPRHDSVTPQPSLGQPFRLFLGVFNADDQDFSTCTDQWKGTRPQRGKQRGETVRSPSRSGNQEKRVVVNRKREWAHNNNHHTHTHNGLHSTSVGALDA